MTRLRIIALASSLSLTVGACATTSGSGGGAAGGTDPVADEPAAYSGPRTIHKGEDFDTILHGGEEHKYLIELEGGEAVTFGIEGDSENCGNWSYAWHQPSDEWVTGNPLPLDEAGATRSAQMPLRAEVAGGGEMTPVAGTYTFVLTADAANCPSIRYRLRAD